MYVPGTREAHTIQVKAAEKPFPDGGTGPMAMGWFFPKTCKAQWLAGVDLSRDMVWLFAIEDAIRLARGQTAQLNLYWHLEPPRRRVIGLESDFEQYRFNAVIDGLLGGEVTELP